MKKSEKEHIAWLGRAPKKIVAVKVLIWTQSDKILLVKPHYNRHWQLPGGLIETGESPINAAIREVNEETGMTLNSNNLEIIDCIFKQESETVVLIYNHTVKIKESGRIKISKDELEDYSYVSKHKAISKLSTHYLEFWNRYTQNT